VSAVELSNALLKALSKLYDEVAVVVVENEKTMVKLWNTELSVVQTWTETEINLRLAKSRRLWTVYLSARDPLYVVKSAEEIVKLADRIEEAELYAPLPEPGECDPLEDAYDVNVEALMKDPSKPVEAMVDEALSNGAERVAGTLTLAKTSRVLLTSKGFQCTEKTTSIEAYIRAFKGEFSGHWAHGSTRLSLNDIRAVGRKAGLYATITSNRGDISPGTYNVVISPLVAGNLLNYIAMMASALSVMAGFSVFAKYKVGEKIASDDFTLLDKPRDPTLPHARGFDDEGLKTFNKPIIENGTVKTLLHNSGTALKMGDRSTGNAGWIRPVAWNLEVSGGEIKEEELFSEVREGVVITNNWYTRLQNYYEGLFSTVSRDATLMVKNGEVTGYVGRVRMATSFPRFLSSIVGASRNRYDIWWWEVRTPTRTPYFILQNIPITKPEV